MGKKKLIIVITALFVLFCAIYLPGYSRLQKLRERNRHYHKRIELLREHNAELRTELEKLRNDPEYLEKKAREKLGIIKKGEVIYRPSSRPAGSD